MVKSLLIKGILPLLVLATLSGCASKSIRTAIEIEAPPAKVYAVLSDLKSYPLWNPYHRKVVGEFEEGADLAVHITRPDGEQVDIPPHMIRIEPDRAIVWGGGIQGIFYGEHRFLLEPLSQTRTLLRHDEDFSGIAVGFADLPADVIADGYQQMNRALKEHVENRKYD